MLQCTTYKVINEVVANEIFNEVLNEMCAICDKIPRELIKTTLNKPIKSYRTYGNCCRHYINYYIYDKRKICYEISINKAVYGLELTDEVKQWLKSVIAHEIVHTICFDDGHGDIFSYYTHTIGDKLGYTIPVVYSDIPKQKTIENSFIANTKYIITCSCCGKIVAKRSRMCEIIKHPELYQTACCNEALKCTKNF